MNHRTRINRSTLLTTSLLAAVFLLAAVAPPVVAQDEGMGEMPPMGRPAEMDELEFMQGDWDVTMKYRMGPQMPWQESTGKATTEAILDGCAQRMDFTGNVMGMEMHGFDITTYNRETDQYESAWFDDMGARMSTMAGNFDEDGNLVMTGTDVQGGVEMDVRTTSRIESEDEVQWTMEMSVDGGQSWFESMQMVYTRAK